MGKAMLRTIHLRPQDQEKPTLRFKRSVEQIDFKRNFGGS